MERVLKCKVLLASTTEEIERQYNNFLGNDFCPGNHIETTHIRKQVCIRWSSCTPKPTVQI